MRAAIRFAVLGLFLNSAHAQAQPDVAQILKAIGETYKGVSQYELEVNIVTNDGGMPSTVHQHIVFKRDKYRTEGPMPGQGGDGVVTIVHDGSTVWFYSTMSNEYGSIPATELTPDAPGDLGDLRPEAMDYFLTWRWRGAADFSNGAKFLREEIVQFGGSQVPTYVLTVITDRRGRSGPVYTWWVDKNNYQILREDSSSGSAVFTSIRLNAAIRDELFTFVPPSGARKIERQ